MSLSITDIATQGIAALANNASITASADGSEVDLSDFDGPITITVHIGAVTGTNPTLAIAIKTAPISGGTYAAGPDGTLFNLTSADANTVKAITLPKTIQGFVKIGWTIGGTSTPTFPISALAFGQKHISGTGGQGFTLAPTNAY